MHMHRVMMRQASFKCKRAFFHAMRSPTALAGTSPGAWRKIQSQAQGSVDLMQAANVANSAPSSARSGWNHETSSLASCFRTHTCGELKVKHVLERVRLSGWIESIRPFGPITFVSLRDRYGITQLVFKEEENDALVKRANALGLESVVQIDGQVLARPHDMINKEQAAGEVEVAVHEMIVISEAGKLPMKVFQGAEEPNEDTRLLHRYLDLRREKMQANLAMRSKVTMTARNYLCDHGFLEIETPTLFKSTPEGAREFLVPTRTKDKFYALTQSPQQYKQLLMVGGLDRYFQIARCYRDEGGRADRQPEFTQIDIEMSFVDMQKIMQMVEGMVIRIWQSSGKWNKMIDMASNSIPVLSYDDVMNRYGSDKPDMRYGLEIVDVTDVLKDTLNDTFQQSMQKGDTVKAINAKNLALLGFSRKDVDALKNAAMKHSPDGLPLSVVKIENGKWNSPLAKMLSPREISKINDRLDVADGDVLLIAVGKQERNCVHLGRMRTHCSELLYQRGFLQKELEPNNYKMLWVVNFPLFEENDTGGLCATHHPFTAPEIGDHDKLVELISQVQKNGLTHELKHALLSLRAQHFDIVCNGWEMGGGSVRIHSGELQKRIFEDILNLSQPQKESFSHLLKGLSSGCPPHGGIALGLDRLVAIFCAAPSIRDVIAFPKTTAGRELMTESPSFVLPSQLEEYHIKSSFKTTA